MLLSSGNICNCRYDIYENVQIRINILPQNTQLFRTKILGKNKKCTLFINSSQLISKVYTNYVLKQHFRCNFFVLSI